MQELAGCPLPKKGFRLEKDFTSHLGKWIKKQGYFFHKISDEGRGLKPYDSIICTHSNTYHCEIKVIKSDNFTIKEFRPNQIKALTDITRLGGQAIIIVYSAKENKYLVQPFSLLML